MEDKDKQLIDEIASEANTNKEFEELFTIKIKHMVDTKETEGVTMNDIYEFSVNGSLSEIGDGIAKFALELPKNEFGENSDSFFVALINNFYSQLKENKE